MQTNEGEMKDIEDLSIEILGVSAMALQLSICFDDTNERVPDECIGNILYGMSLYLDRISEDLSKVTQGTCCTLLERGLDNHAD